MNGVEESLKAWGELMKQHRPAFTFERPRPEDEALIEARAAKLARTGILGVIKANVVVSKKQIVDASLPDSDPLVWITPGSELPGIVTDEWGGVTSINGRPVEPFHHTELD